MTHDLDIKFLVLNKRNTKILRILGYNNLIVTKKRWLWEDSKDLRLCGYMFLDCG